MNMCNQLAGTLRASLTPYLAERYGWTASFLVTAGLAFVGGLCWFFVDLNRELAPADRAPEPSLFAGARN
jgi:ACS family glucarate transporter-like MFS transporter